MTWLHRWLQLRHALTGVSTYDMLSRILNQLEHNSISSNYLSNPPFNKTIYYESSIVNTYYMKEPTKDTFQQAKKLECTINI